MDNNYLVSVIVPVYNNESYVEKCLKSIFVQTYKNIEIIVVNDGSKDESENIIRQLASMDDRIKYYFQPNKGVSAARNLGIKKAKGDYICFVDGDDFVSIDYVEYLMGICQYNLADVGLTTKMFGNYNKKQTKRDSMNVWTNYEATINMLSYNIPIGVYNKIFKTELIKENKIFFLENLFIGEGFNFNMAALQAAKSVAVGSRKIYYYRRDNPNSATTKFSEQKCINGLLALQTIKENLLFSDEKVIKYWNFANWRTYSDIYDIIINCKVKKSFPILFQESYNVTKKGAFSGLFLESVSHKQKIRGVLMGLNPRIIPILLKLRDIIYI